MTRPRTTPVVLPNPPEIYSRSDQVELRRSLEQALASIGAAAASVTLPIHTLLDYGAVGDGVTDDTGAFQAALDVGGWILMPPGDYLVTDELIWNVDNTRLIGADLRICTVIFKPSVTGKRCFYLNKGITTTVEAHPYEGVFDNNYILTIAAACNFSIIGHASASGLQKTGIEAIDTSTFLINRLEVRFVDGSGNAETGNSIGIRIAGRELTTMQNVTVRAPQPMRIGPNPNYATLCADHMHVTDWYSICDEPTGAHIYIEPLTVLSNVTFDGQQAYALGTYGVYWPDTRRDPATGLSAVGAYDYASNNVVFANQRVEQTTAGGWAWYITANCYALSIVNAYSGLENNCYLRFCTSVQLGPMVHPSITAGIALDAKFCGVIEGSACYFQDSTTLNLNSNMYVVMESPRINSLRCIGDCFIITSNSTGRNAALSIPILDNPTVVNGMHFGDINAYIHPDGLGAATAFVAESASTSNNINYQLVDATKRAWESGTITVYDSGVLVNPALYTLSLTIGAVSFGSAAARVITVSGNYYPPTGWGSNNYQNTQTNFFVGDDGTVTAYSRLVAPSIVGTGPSHFFGSTVAVGTAHYIDGATGQQRGAYLRSAGVNRAFMGLSAVGETGASAGSTWQVLVYDDAATVYTALDISRVDGATRFLKVGFNGNTPVGKQVSGGTTAGVIAGLVALGLFSS